MNEIVTIEPWNPWPLAIPILIAIGGIVLSSFGTRRRSKPIRSTRGLRFPAPPVG